MAVAAVLLLMFLMARANEAVPPVTVTDAVDVNTLLLVNAWLARGVASTIAPVSNDFRTCFTCFILFLLDVPDSIAESGIKT
jgi:hypothetical protein